MSDRLYSDWSEWSQSLTLRTYSDWSEWAQASTAALDLVFADSVSTSESESASILQTHLIYAANSSSVTYSALTVVYAGGPLLVDFDEGRSGVGKGVIRLAYVQSRRLHTLGF